MRFRLPTGLAVLALAVVCFAAQPAQAQRGGHYGRGFYGGAYRGGLYGGGLYGDGFYRGYRYPGDWGYAPYAYRAYTPYYYEAPATVYTERNYYNPPTYVETPATVAAPATAVASTVARVTIMDNAIEPRTLTVAPGTTIQFVNNCARPESIVANNGSWTSGNMPTGMTFNMTFREPGMYTFHSGGQVQGTIIVSGAAPSTGY